MQKRRLMLQLAAYVLVVGCLLYTLYTSPYNPRPSSVAEVRFWVGSFGAWAPLIYLALYTFRPLLFFPTLLLNLSAGVLFGPWLGIVLVLMGGLGCASFCYILGRYGGGRWLLHNFGGSWGERLRAYMLGGSSFIKLLWLRTVPIFPYDPVSIISGSLGLPLGIYLGATLLGMLPGAVAYNFLADSFGTSRFYGAIAVTVLAFGLPLLCWRWRCGRKVQ